MITGHVCGGGERPRAPEAPPPCPWVEHREKRDLSAVRFAPRHAWMHPPSMAESRPSKRESETVPALNHFTDSPADMPEELRDTEM